METDGLICAYLLDGHGGARKLGWGDVKQWKPEQGPAWFHFDYTRPETVGWISRQSGLEPVAASVLLTEESRPRATPLGRGMLIALRGVNLNPGSNPEDMVAVRVWVDEHRVISTRRRTLLCEADIVQSLAERKGPRTTGEFLVDLADCLVARTADTVENIEDRVAQMEQEVMASESHALRTRLAEVRREAIMLRRYLAPQREAMMRLHAEDVPWLSADNRLRLKEATDRLMRCIEDLDSARDRAAVTQEELANRLAEQLNKRMYVLSLVAAVFLPLGFFTGLLGINLGGIPGADDPSAFLIFVLILAAVVALQLIIFKTKKWL
ncbi:MAG: zinc transporter ZntB [Planctomycetes bacterium]|nr:zinc transporter ZntB [Planctomycetota bacterium]